MKLETRIAIEKRIARKTIEVMVAAGFYVKVFDGEEWACSATQDVKLALDAMLQTDDDKLYVLAKNDSTEPDARPFKRIGWVWFVYGNSGYDVVCDYTTNLEPQMKEVDAYADEQERIYA